MTQSTKFPFASSKHFLDLVVDDPDFKSHVLDNIIQEKYQISKRIHTSFTELDNITSIERKAILKLILKDLEEQKRIMDATRQRTGKNG